MKVIIIEDEYLAAEALSNQLRKIHPEIQILDVLDTVKSAVQWFTENSAPDLAFFDIQLADGLSFEIFEQVNITCPVVFTTAYDTYALRAFKVNSIDYLLKPVDTTALKTAFDKLALLRNAGTQSPQPQLDMEVIRQMLHRTSPKYKTRFMVKIGDRLAAFATSEIEYFYGENKIVWLRHQNGRKYIIDYTLDELEDLLDPETFYRLNRKYIVTFESIKEVIAWSNSRLKITLKDPPDTEDILISREKAEDFRVWLGK